MSSNVWAAKPKFATLAAPAGMAPKPRAKNAPGSQAMTGADDGFQPLQEFSDNVTVRPDPLAMSGQGFPGNLPIPRLAALV